MKFINSLLYIVVISVFFTSCGNDKEQVSKDNVVTEKNIAENIKNVEIEIKGMTCEIGCARLIQSKLYKANGIKFAKVSFADSLGSVTYDANRISETEIKSIIEKVAGGDLYKVSGVKEVLEFEKTESTNKN